MAFFFFDGLRLEKKIEKEKYGNTTMNTDTVIIQFIISNK